MQITRIKVPDLDKGTWLALVVITVLFTGMTIAIIHLFIEENKMDIIDELCAPTEMVYWRSGPRYVRDCTGVELPFELK